MASMEKARSAIKATGATVGEGATTGADHDNGEQRPLRATTAVAGVDSQEEIGYLTICHS
jgi:hypothetical protein